jgi:hypothetical protein
LAPVYPEGQERPSVPIRCRRSPSHGEAVVEVSFGSFLAADRVIPSKPISNTDLTVSTSVQMTGPARVDASTEVI